MLSVAILAGGLATRLHPITEKIPKSLVIVAGRPFICWQLEYLRRQGIQRVTLCVGHLGEMIKAEVGSGERFGLEVSYAPDGPVLLGTGGALRKTLPLLGEAFFVLYGDSFLPIQFQAVENAYALSGKPALMTVLANADRWDKSNVLFQDGELIEYNKHTPRPEMAYIDYGLGVLQAATLLPYPMDRPFDLADLYHDLSLRGHLVGHEVHERFYEIGSHTGLQETEAYFLERADI
jgi:N-acetyl-alpha-D-muramate 1-phosphate uridylyltransferase